MTRQAQRGPHLTIASVLLALASVAHPLAAQRGRLPLPVIGQVVDEVLHAIVPPDSSLSRVPVRERGMYFDYGRTLAAFDYRGATATLVFFIILTFIADAVSSWGRRALREA